MTCNSEIRCNGCDVGFTGVYCEIATINADKILTSFNNNLDIQPIPTEFSDQWINTMLNAQSLIKTNPQYAIDSLVTKVKKIADNQMLLINSESVKPTTKILNILDFSVELYKYVNNNNIHT